MRTEQFELHPAGDVRGEDVRTSGERRNRAAGVMFPLNVNQILGKFWKSWEKESTFGASPLPGLK